MANKAKAMNCHQKVKRKMLNEFWQFQLHLDHLALPAPRPVQTAGGTGGGEGATGTPSVVGIE